MNNKVKIDHADIVVSHACNMKCPFCIDRFVNTDNTIISLNTVEKFLKMLYSKTKRYYCDVQKDDKLTVLLLGGEPTIIGSDKLIDIAELVHQYGFNISISTNGQNKDIINQIASYFDWIQITFHAWNEFDYWETNIFKNKINIKLPGDTTLTKMKLDKFIERSQSFKRKSISMYFTPDFKELCRDKEVWNFLNLLHWDRLGSYMYAFCDGVRFKKCIPNETNIIYEDLIPKLYPNGNYNRTWNNECLDDYIDGNWDA